MKRVFLIGYRGAGKTTIGRLLAEQIGWDFVDADELLESTHGKTIREIFATEGEPAFRDKETQILHELSLRERVVVGAGGGAIGREQNRARLRESGFVVWLTADVPTIAARLQADPTTPERRPDLTTGGLSEIETLLRLREPLYRETADLTIDTRERSPQAIVETILTAWDSSGSRASG